MLEVEKVKAAALDALETEPGDHVKILKDFYHIASPQAVLELIARLEAAESKQILSASARHFKQMEERLEAAEKENAVLLAAIEAKDVALKASDELLRDLPESGDFYGLSVTENNTEALALAPSAELLEQRDRKRDAKLLRHVAKYWRNNQLAYPMRHIETLANDRESGEWIPELGD